MRDIKFRAKSLVNDFKSDVKEGDWVKGYYVVLKDGDTEVHYILTGESDLFYGSGTARETFKKYKVDPETVGQYTGLKDKNGKEIYEGDIVRFDVVGIDETMPAMFYQVGVVKIQKGILKLGSWIASFCKNIKVIGNVYDDKELLED